MPSFWPTLEATIPKTASGTRATTQSKTFISSSKPIVSRSTTGWNDVSPRALWLSRILTRPIPSASVRSDELRQVVLGEGLADAPRDQLDQQVGDTSSWPAAAAVARLGERGPSPGWNRFGQGQADAASRQAC